MSVPLMSRIYEALTFRREDKFLYKLDPRLKLLILIVHVVAIVSTFNIFYLSVLLVLVVSVSLLLANWKRVFQALIASWRFLIILFVVVYVFSSYPYVISLKAFLNATVSVVKLSILILVFSQFFTTTHPDDLAQALVKLGLKFDVAYTIVLSMRFIPTVVKDFQIVYDAQRSRGLEVEKGSLIEKVKKMVPIIVPAFILTFLRVDRVAEAMESRGFGASKKRSFMYELKVTFRDILSSIALSTIPILIILLENVVGYHPAL